MKPATTRRACLAMAGDRGRGGAATGSSSGGTGKGGGAAGFGTTGGARTGAAAGTGSSHGDGGKATERRGAGEGAGGTSAGAFPEVMGARYPEIHWPCGGTCVPSSGSRLVICKVTLPPLELVTRLEPRYPSPLM